MQTSMQLDPGSPFFRLLSKGIQAETRDEIAAAILLYQQAWDISTTDDERFIAAQHLSRRPPGVADKLKWHEVSLELALKIGGKHMERVYPTQHVNIGQCYEDMADYAAAEKHYQSAQALARSLPNNKYTKSIMSVIADSLKRVSGRQA
jgi:tetratricopeptide (TPR) repeat protein